jgi:flagellar basal body-associated protein FliL
MRKALTWLLPVLVASSAYAQSSGAEAPTEKAGPVTVIIFLVLFVGSCVGYFAYIWWSHRKARLEAEGKAAR